MENNTISKTPYANAGVRCENKEDNNKYDFKLDNSDVYTGEMKEGLIQGKGKMTYKNGDTYEGEFRHNRRHGNGTYTFKKTGESYEGQWNNNLFVKGKKKSKENKQEEKIEQSEETNKLFNQKEDDVYKNLLLYTLDEDMKKSKHGNKYRIFYDKIDEKDKQYRKIHKQDELLYFLQVNERKRHNQIKRMNVRNNVIYKNLFNNKNDEDFEFGSIKDREFIKIQYNDHGDITTGDNSKFGQLRQSIDEKNFDIDNNCAKTLYLSMATCYGAFYDKEGNNLMEILQKKIKGKNIIGFFSHSIKKTTNLGSTIDNNNDCGLKRSANMANYEKKSYLNYYMLLEDGNGKQHIYSIPYELCYWREDLIRKELFFQAVSSLVRNKQFAFKNEVIKNDGNRTITTETIEIEGEIKEVEMKKEKKSLFNNTDKYYFETINKKEEDNKNNNQELLSLLQCNLSKEENSESKCCVIF